MPIDGYEVHPAADVFPMLDDAALRELADDIRENGLRDSITRIWVDAGAGNGTLKPQILDGRNRFRACEIANVLPQFVDYEGADPVAFVVSKNLRRRHLSPSQKAMAAADLAQLANGTNQHARREKRPPSSWTCRLPRSIARRL
jgi:ParB-like chromosome segregation protein Spo0J